MYVLDFHVMESKYYHPRTLLSTSNSKKLDKYWTKGLIIQYYILCDTILRCYQGKATTVVTILHLLFCVSQTWLATSLQPDLLFSNKLHQLLLKCRVEADAQAGPP